CPTQARSVTLERIASDSYVLVADALRLSIVAEQRMDPDIGEIRIARKAVVANDDVARVIDLRPRQLDADQQAVQAEILERVGLDRAVLAVNSYPAGCAVGEHVVAHDKTGADEIEVGDHVRPPVQRRRVVPGWWRWH